MSKSLASLTGLQKLDAIQRRIRFGERKNGVRGIGYWASVDAIKRIDENEDSNVRDEGLRTQNRCA